MRWFKPYCFLLVLVAALWVAHTEANASQSSRSLQAGKTYEFVSTDLQSTLYVSFGSNTQYEYVYYDRAGEVVDYGLAIGRAQIKSGGTTRLTVKQSVSVSFTAAKVTAREVSSGALWRTSVAQNKTVTVTNQNAKESRSISIDNTGRTENARYDLVVRDKTGQATHYASDNLFTVIGIPEGGSATITSLSDGEMRLMLPTTWKEADLSFRNETAAALHYQALKAGVTYTLTYGGTTADCNLRVTPGKTGVVRYDYIRQNDLDVVTGYAHDAEAEQLAVTSGGSLLITPSAAGNGLTLVYPSEYNRLLRITEGGAGALITYTVPVGQSLTFTNNSLVQSYTFFKDPADPSAVMDYVYTSGQYGEVHYKTEVTFDQMTLGAGHAWTFTVKTGSALTLRMPASWLGTDIMVQGAAAQALATYNLAPGKTLVFENHDSVTAYPVNLEPVRSQDAILYAYMRLNETEFDFVTQSRESALNVPPSGTLTITAGAKQPLVVRVAAGWIGDVLTVTETDEQLVYSYTLNVGESVLMENQSDAQFPFIAGAVAEGSSLSMDFVVKDDKKQVVDFGAWLADSGNLSQTLDAGNSLLITNKGNTPVKVSCPQSWVNEGLKFSKSTAKALSRQTVKDTQNLDIINVDKRYNYSVKVENATIGLQTTPVKYDYVSRNAKSVVLEYGAGVNQDIYLYSNGKTTIAPQKGVTLSLCYPAEWENKIIKLAAASEAPLYRKILRPNDKLYLYNKTDDEYLIQNNSAQSMAQYFIRSIETNLVPSNEKALSGYLSLPAKTTIVLVAAPGYNLELWMPQDWAKKLLTR